MKRRPPWRIGVGGAIDQDILTASGTPPLMAGLLCRRHPPADRMNCPGLTEPPLTNSGVTSDLRREHGAELAGNVCRRAAGSFTSRFGYTCPTLERPASTICACLDDASERHGFLDPGCSTKIV